VRASKRPRTPTCTSWTRPGATRSKTTIAEIEEIERAVDPDDRSLLVLDAAIGQGAKEQARQFEKSIGIEGVMITKLDGTAKGGVR